MAQSASLSPERETFLGTLETPHASPTLSRQLACCVRATSSAFLGGPPARASRVGGADDAPASDGRERFAALVLETLEYPRSRFRRIRVWARSIVFWNATDHLTLVSTTLTQFNTEFLTSSTVAGRRRRAARRAPTVLAFQTHIPTHPRGLFKGRRTGCEPCAHPNSLKQAAIFFCNEFSLAPQSVAIFLRSSCAIPPRSS